MPDFNHLVPDLKLSPYFTQTQFWAKFWAEASGPGHWTELVQIQTDQCIVYAYVYRYPWYFNQAFVYVPRGPVVQPIGPKSLSKTELLRGLSFFWQRLQVFAREHNLSFLKIELDSNLADELQIISSTELGKLMQHSFNLDSKPAVKQIMPGATVGFNIESMILPILDSKFEPDNTAQLDFFMQLNSSFWHQRNKTIRNATRRSLKVGWEISFDKGADNLNKFWEVYLLTAARQRFGTHPKLYYQKLLQHDFSKLIVLSFAGQAHAVWIGVEIDGVLTHLFGGNTDFSLKNFGQPLLHLVALARATAAGNQVYDFGGYDSEKGYGKFKQSYHPTVVNFPGPIDIPIHPIQYAATNSSIRVVKLARKILVSLNLSLSQSRFNQV